MCGIVAVAGFISANEEKAFKLMLELDVIRGRHSTGIIAVDYAKNVYSHKEAWLPQDFLETTQVKNIFQKNLKLLVGHNRHATVGGVSKATAHPFEFDKVIGVHNGTTSKFLFDGHTDFAVDSEALYNHLNNLGVESMWENMSGAASLVYYDKETQRLNFLRNAERPMHRRESEDGKTVFFASEGWMIHIACVKSGVKLKKEDVEHKVNTLYTFNPFDTNDVKTPVEVAVNPHVKKPQTTYTGGSGGLITGTRRFNQWAMNILSLWVHDWIDFKVVRVTKNKTSYTFDVMSTETPIELPGRLYLSHEHPLVKTLKNPQSTFEGRIQAKVSGEYFVLDAGSVVESANFNFLDDDAPSEEDVIQIEFGQGNITRRAFSKDSECLSCGDPQNFDAVGKDFKFIWDAGSWTPLCSDCLVMMKDDSLVMNSVFSGKVIKGVV